MKNPFKKSQPAQNNNLGLSKDHFGVSSENKRVFTESRENEINGAIEANHEQIKSDREAKNKVLRRRGFMRRLLAGGAAAAIAVGGVKAAENQTEHDRAVDANNAPLATQIQKKVEDNKMAEQAMKDGAAVDAEVAKREESDANAVSQAQHDEAVATNEAIIKANEGSDQPK